MTAVVAHDSAVQLAREFADDVRDGLLARPKRLPGRWRHDDRGAALFEAACAAPECYVAAAERTIVDDHLDDVVRRVPADVEVIELGRFGAGGGRALLEALLAGDARALHVDDHEQVLDRLRIPGDQPRLVLWLGSSIGNFDRRHAAEVLGRLAGTLAARDRVLVGIDLRKDRATLERAYDDAAGAAARFNRNLLARINRELGGRFEVEGFRHQALYHEREGRVETRLVALQPMRVPIVGLGIEAVFERGETIHTEDAYKYALWQIADLASAADLVIERQWFDPRWFFSLNLLAP